MLFSRSFNSGAHHSNQAPEGESSSSNSSVADECQTPTHLLQAAWRVWAEGQFTCAQKLFESAWELAKRQQSPQDRSRACDALAEFYRRTGNSLLAQQYTQLAISAALELPVEHMGEETAAIPAVKPASPELLVLKGQESFLKGDWNSGFDYWEQGALASHQQGDFEGCQRIRELSNKTRRWIERLNSDPNQN